MKAMGLMQSKWCPKGRHFNFAQDPLCSNFDEQQKNEFISYIYTLFYIVFVQYLWSFGVNFVK